MKQETLNKFDPNEMDLNRGQKTEPLEKAKAGKAFVLQERDVLCLSFVCEMKFSLANQIMRSVYSKLPDGIERSSDNYTRRRLSQLVKEGFLKTFKRPDYYEYLYVLTPKGFRALYQYLSDDKIGRPCFNFKPSHFNHDCKVIETRLIFEKEGRSFEWFGERRIKSSFKIFSQMSDIYIPDALFVSKERTLIALEFENSRRSKERYLQKINNYVEMIKNHFDSPIKFKKVLFVSDKPEIIELLENLILPWGDLFSVENFSSYFKPSSSDKN